MNNEQRKRIRDALSRAKSSAENFRGDVESFSEVLRECAEEEQEKFDNLSEGLQQAERGQKLEQASGELTDCSDTADSIGSELDDLITKAEEILEAMDSLESDVESPLE